MLHVMPNQRLTEAARDPTFLSLYDAAIERLLLIEPDNTQLESERRSLAGEDEAAAAAAERGGGLGPRGGLRAAGGPGLECGREPQGAGGHDLDGVRQRL